MPTTLTSADPAPGKSRPPGAPAELRVEGMPPQSAMINVYHLASAAPIAMFGMFALWAAASKRHWFVRTFVVAAAVLATLLVPAYELAYQLGIESLVVVGGMAIWRRFRLRNSNPKNSQGPGRRFSLSLESLMLVVVIVAVATAVISRTPSIEVRQWYDLVINGVTAGAICLACVWLVCGRASWRKRLLLAPFLVVALAAAIHFIKWAESIVRYWIFSTSPLTNYLQIVWRDTWPGILFWTTAVGLAMAVLCAWLFLMQSSGWFDPFRATTAPIDTETANRRAVLARWATLALFCIAAVFPIALFYRLLTPTPIPTEDLPVPNGFDDFVAAGREVSPAAAEKLVNWDQLSDDQLSAELEKITAAFDRMREGFTKPCLHPYVFKPWVQEDAAALNRLLAALYAQAALSRRTGDLELELANYVNLLRLTHAESRGTATDYYPLLGQYEWDAHSSIWNLRERLSAQQCKRLVAELSELDRRREPWSVRARRQRIIEANAGWQRHAQLILQEWSGNESNPRWRIDHFRRVTELRILIIELSLRAHELDHGRLPTHLSELLSDYLPFVPQDPFGDGGMNYRLASEPYELYSVGPDGSDDGGKRAGIRNGAEIGDLTPAAVFGPPVVANQPVTQNSGAGSDP
jgi:hypothetical protein